MRTTYVSKWYATGLKSGYNELEIAFKVKEDREHLEWTGVHIEQIEEEAGRYRVTVSGVLPELKPREIAGKREVPVGVGR